ncbi:MAG: hypothetical protein JNJ77_19995 [Planctomycetia bacterium]|nr:hypothetical protein [Planctomycetia bacterium]
MMKLWLLTALLCFASTLHAQIVIGHRHTDLEILEARQTMERLDKSTPGTLTVGSQFTTPEVAKAKDIIEKLKPKKLQIQVGEFEVVHPHKDVTTPLLWVVQDESLLERITVPAKQPFAIWGVRRGETVARLHLFEAKDLPWVILVAKKEGTGNTHIVRNGDSLDKAPVIIDSIEATVGNPAPTPPPNPKPVPIPTPDADTALVKEFKELLTKDRAATDGNTWPKAKDWAESFIDSSKLLKLNDPAIAPRTLADLYAKHKAAWIADEVPVLPFLTYTRTKAAQIIESELGKDANATLDREKASKVYERIGTALLEALK